jgi:hypothetical protein
MSRNVDAKYELFGSAAVLDGNTAILGIEGTARND